MYDKDFSNMNMWLQVLQLIEGTVSKHTNAKHIFALLQSAT